VTPVEFRGDLWHQKTRVFGVSCGVVCVILRLALLVEHRLVTDRRTQGHGYYRGCIASRGKIIVAGFEYQVMPRQVTLRNRESASPKPLRKMDTCYDIQKFRKTDSSAAKQRKRQAPQRQGDQTTSPNTGSGIWKIPDQIEKKHPLL